MFFQGTNNNSTILHKGASIFYIPSSSIKAQYYKNRIPFRSIIWMNFRLQNITQTTNLLVKKHRKYNSFTPESYLF